MARGMKVMVDPAFPDHRKVRALGRALKIHPMQALGHVVALWCRVMKEAPLGNIRTWNEDDIADAAKWEGDPKKLVAALRSKDVLFLDRYQVHDWIEEQGEIVAKRENWRKEKAIQRIREKEKKEAEEAAKKTVCGHVQEGQTGQMDGVRVGQNGSEMSGKTMPLSTPPVPFPSLPVPSVPVPTSVGKAGADIAAPEFLSGVDSALAAGAKPSRAKEVNPKDEIVRQIFKRSEKLHLRNNPSTVQRWIAAHVYGGRAERLNDLFFSDQCQGMSTIEIDDRWFDHKDSNFKEERDRNGPPKL